MTSNLLIASAGIPAAASALTASNVAASGYPETNLAGGSKADSYRLATATTGDVRLTYQTSGSAANFLYLGKVNTLYNANVSAVTLKGYSSNNYASAATVLSIPSLGAIANQGPALDDYVVTFATSASYAWWFANYNQSSTGKTDHAKLFFGTYFDPGRDPSGEVRAVRTRPTGARRRALYTLEVSWEGLAYAKAVAMYREFYRPRRHSPVILFTYDYHDLLFGHRVLYGRVTDMSVPPRATDYCDATMTFEELP